MSPYRCQACGFPSRNTLDRCDILAGQPRFMQVAHGAACRAAYGVGVWRVRPTIELAKKSALAIRRQGHTRLKCDSFLFRRLLMPSSLKTPDDIVQMREVCRLAAEVLDYIEPFVKPGVTTLELDRLCHEYTVNVQNCIPARLTTRPPAMSPSRNRSALRSIIRSAMASPMSAL